MGKLEGRGLQGQSQPGHCGSVFPQNSLRRVALGAKAVWAPEHSWCATAGQRDGPAHLPATGAEGLRHPELTYFYGL